MRFKLNEQFESWGGFREAETDQPISFGRVRYEPNDGITLELLIDPSRGNPLKLMFRDRFVFWGHLANGIPTTLFDCFVTGAGIASKGGIIPTVFFVNQAYLGGHFTDPDSLLIRSRTVEFTSLPNWLGTPPPKITSNKIRGTGIEAVATFTAPNPITIPVPNRGFSLRFCTGCETSERKGAASIRRSVALAIEAHRDMTVAQSRELSWQCQNLLTLLIGNKISVKSVEFLPAKHCVDESYDPTVQMLFSQRGIHDEPDISTSEMILPYGSVKDQITNVVQAWFSRSEQAELASNVFFGSDLLESPAANVKFLAVMQAAESYHRSLSSSTTYMDSDAYDQAIRQILPCIPDCIRGDHRDSLESRIKYGNELSLRRRIKGLFARIPDVLQSSLTSSVSRFVARAVETRNYYTHYDHSARELAFDGEETLIAAGRLRYLLVANMLVDLRIEGDRIVKGLERNRDFRYWVSCHLRL